HTSFPRPNTLRQTFINDVNFNLPANIERTVAISNGSQNSTNQGFNPGDLILDAKSIYIIINAYAKIWAVPSAGAGSSTVFDGKFDFPLFGFSIFSKIGVGGTLPIDGSPGGFHPSTYSLASGFGQVSTLHQTHCFIPTTSAL